MPPFVVNKIFFLLSGPLHGRLASLLDLITLCRLMNYDYKVLWGPHEEGCQIQLHDILINDEILSRVAKDVSTLHESSSYYYNPNIPSHIILQYIQSNRKANSPVDVYEWLVIASEAEANLVPPTINNTSFKLERQKQYRQWDFDFSITGYLNAMKSEYGTNVIGLYVKNHKYFVDDAYYLDFISTFSPASKLFVGFSSEVSIKDRKDTINILKNHNPPSRIFQLSVSDNDNHSLDDLLTFVCFVDGCKVVVTEEGSVDAYINNIVAINLTPFCVVDPKKKTTRLENCSYEKLLMFGNNGDSGHTSS